MRLNTTSDQERSISRAEENIPVGWSVHQLIKIIDQLDTEITEQSVEIVRLKSQLAAHAQKTNS